MSFRKDYKFISKDKVRVVFAESLPIPYRFMVGKTGEIVGQYVFPYATNTAYVVEIRRWWG